MDGATEQSSITTISPPSPDLGWYFDRSARRVVFLDRGLHFFDPGASRGLQLHMRCLSVFFFLLLVALVGGSDCGRAKSLSYKIQCWPLVQHRSLLEPTYELRDGEAPKRELIQWAIDRIEGLREEINCAKGSAVYPREPVVAGEGGARSGISALCRVIHFPEESTFYQVVEGAGKLIAQLGKELEGLQPRLAPELNEPSIRPRLKLPLSSDYFDMMVLLRRANLDRIGRRLLAEASTFCFHGQAVDETDVEQHLYQMRAQIETLRGQVDELEDGLRALQAATQSTDRVIGILSGIQLQRSSTKPASLPYTPSMDRLELEFFALRDLVGLDSKEVELGTILSTADVAVNSLIHHKSQLVGEAHSKFLAALKNDPNSLYIANALLLELREQALQAY